MRLIDADKIIDDYNASSGTISDLMELILDAADKCTASRDLAEKVAHAHVVVNWLGDCRCSNCGESIDCTAKGGDVMAEYPDFVEKCGYDSVTGIGGANCR